MFKNALIIVLMLTLIVSSNDFFTSFEAEAQTPIPDLTRSDVIKLVAMNQSTLNLRGVILVGEDLSYMDLSNMTLILGNLSDTILTDTQMVAVKAQRAVFDRADLENSILANANLNWASLVNTNLEGADFTNAVLTNTDLTGASLLGARLENAHLRGAIMPDGQPYTENTNLDDFTNQN